MAQQLGRISGPLLVNNLVRANQTSGEVDLAFETDLLYIDVINGRIGVKTDAPTRELLINGTTKTDYLIVDTRLDAANISFFNDQIQNLVNSISIIPDQTTNPVVKGIEFQTANLSFTNQRIENLITNSNIEITANGLGEVQFYTTVVNVNGDLHATGDITWDGGSITIGTDDNDNVVFNSDVSSHLIPNLTNTYDIGTSEKEWKTLYTHNVKSDTVTVDSVIANDIDLLLRQGNTIYVSTTGNDTLSSGSTSFIGTYDNGVSYAIGDVVLYTGKYYRRISDAGNIGYAPTDLTRWVLTQVTSNEGTHPHSPFRTIKHALSVAQSGDEVVIFPGTYTEEFPLTVPQGVSVRGAGIRSVSIQPTTGTNNKDCFLLNGETTVSFLTVQNFFYNSTNDTGYAFRLAQNCKVTTRSPYMFNVTVITKGAPHNSSIYISNLSPTPPGVINRTVYLDGTLNGKVYYQDEEDHRATVRWTGSHWAYIVDGIPFEVATSFDDTTYPWEANWSTDFVMNPIGGSYSPSDPLGFNQGNAGCGALIDGSVADPDSKEASGLFFSATFIVPNANGIWATNGARVEWLNSFTYYAHRGIYLTTGTLGFANLNTKFGAEMRSINSANVYGTYGAVADGADTLGYLIGHNFGYIGCGADSNNDYGLVVQANEIVAINDGVIYYDSMDHKGDYRIGDIFYVNQETGQVSFDAQSINLSAQGNITLEGPNGVTVIDATQVKTGNIRIFDNNIESLSGPVNFYAASTKTYLNTDVYITGDQDITGNVVVKGTVYLGDTPYDNITILPKLDQTIKPKTDRTYNLGQKGLDPKVWNTLFLKTLDIDAVTEITNNTIQTLTTDTDLEFIASGTGIIHVTGTNVEITEDLTVNGNVTVNGLTSLKNTEITGDVNQTGDFNQTGNTNITGTFQTFNLEVLDTLSYLEVPDIKIITNEIQATATDSDLVFTANGTGGVKLEQYLVITDNEITNERIGATSDLQKSIVFDPNGTGNVEINSTKSIKIPYANNTNRILNQVGELRQNSTTTLYEGYRSSISNASLFNLYDSDRNTYITAELTPGANDNTLRFANNGVVYTTITDYALTNNVVHVDDIRITNNVISNLISSNDINIGIDPTETTSINDILVQENTITNQQNSSLILQSTGTGYYKFAGTNAIVIPTGGDGDRRLTPEVGEIRINSDNDHEMEVFNGVDWIPASGPLSAATEDEVIEIMDTWALILG